MYWYDLAEKNNTIVMQALMQSHCPNMYDAQLTYGKYI